MSKIERLATNSFKVNSYLEHTNPEHGRTEDQMFQLYIDELRRINAYYFKRWN